MNIKFNSMRDWETAENDRLSKQLESKPKIEEYQLLSTDSLYIKINTNKQNHETQEK